MKPNHLFTSMLALAAIVASSCSAPRIAQQNTNDDDDVYNTTAKVKVYTPAPVKPAQSAVADEQQYEESDYYGTSDPYYDMDYSSRINRFYYSTPWRSYYDPYFYGGGFYPSNGWSVGIGYSPFYNSYWNSPYSGWGYASSPFWGYNNWGWNNYYYGGGYYGGGYYGGGFLGGGYYGGGYYTGRTTNVPDYRARPSGGRENGIGRGDYGRVSGRSTVTRSDANGNVISRQSRAERYNAAENNNPTATTRTSNRRTQDAPQQQPQSARPTRTESAAPPARQPESRPAPSYSPPARSEGSSRGSSSGSGSSGGGSRSGRAGRG
jgi:uncharacterized membrane protein YgcG